MGIANCTQSVRRFYLCVVSLFLIRILYKIHKGKVIPKLSGFSLGRLHMGGFVPPVQGDKALMGGLMRGDTDLMGGDPTLIDYIIN